MILSPFNPIFFLGDRRSPGIECPYTQLFGCDDTILIEVIRTADETPCAVTLVNAETGEDVMDLARRTISIGSGEYADCYDMSGVPDGFYFLAIGDEESETFRVTSDPEMLRYTCLIEYSPAENKARRDVIGTANGERIYFSFRIPGGFKDNGWSFSVENEQFVTQLSDIVELYGMESCQYILTMGHSEGVPIWFGDLLNRLLTCKYVYIDGKRYARSESSVPEKEQTIDGTNSFVFTQKLQRINNIEPTKP